MLSMRSMNCSRSTLIWRSRTIRHTRKIHEALPLDRFNIEKPFVMLRELVKKSQNRVFLRVQLVSIFLPAFQAFPIGLANIVFQIARAPRDG